MRVKGRNQSRSKTLDDLLQSLQNIKPAKQNPPVIDEPVSDEEGGELIFGIKKPPITTDIQELLKVIGTWGHLFKQNFLPVVKVYGIVLV